MLVTLCSNNYEIEVCPDSGQRRRETRDAEREKDAKRQKEAREIRVETNSVYVCVCACVRACVFVCARVCVRVFRYLDYLFPLNNCKILPWYCDMILMMVGRPRFFLKYTSDKHKQDINMPRETR